jgi:beta-lactamase class A
MIADSDNTAAKMLTEHIGYDRLNKMFVELGLIDTNISPQSFCMSRWYVSNDSYATPRDIAHLLDQIYNKTLVQPELCAEMLQTLKMPPHAGRLGLYLPEEFELAHKTGLLRGACHDAGLVLSPNGDFLICIMTERNRSYKTAKKFISAIGKLAFELI